ncbi:pharyngeal muscle protein 2-like [Halyomorpha halys]|uniref:pharyngeal muscle protein 2-like n=1 Tax=Halyomorpha halys TaxID=286706 RepID=UPI0006D4E948
MLVPAGGEGECCCKKKCTSTEATKMEGEPEITSMEPETEPTTMEDEPVPVPLEESSNENKDTPTEAAVIMVPTSMGSQPEQAPVEERSDEKKEEENAPTATVVPVLLVPTSMGDAKPPQEQTITGPPVFLQRIKEGANLQPDQPEREPEDKDNEIDTLDKTVSKAEEEDTSMEVCQSETKNPEGLKNNHIKKDLKCKTIGVIKSYNSKTSAEIEDRPSQSRIRQNVKRAIDDKLAMRYVALLDKTMGYPYTTKTPTYDVDDQYNPWRQYTLESMTPGVFPAFYS